MKSAKGGEYGDLAITPDGNLAAVWYEGRWGIITSLEGHSEALDIYNSKGQGHPDRSPHPSAGRPVTWLWM